MLQAANKVLDHIRLVVYFKVSKIEDLCRGGIEYVQS